MGYLKNRLFAKIGFANSFANLYLTKLLAILYIGQKDIIKGIRFSSKYCKAFFEYVHKRVFAKIFLCKYFCTEIS